MESDELVESAARPRVRLSLHRGDDAVYRRFPLPLRPDGDAAGRRPTRPDHNFSEKLSRWLSCVLKFAYTKLGITNFGGWVRLDEVAAAGRRTRSDFHSLVNADALHNLLKELDTVCRFEAIDAMFAKLPGMSVSPFYELT